MQSAWLRLIPARPERNLQAHGGAQSGASEHCRHAIGAQPSGCGSVEVPKERWNVPRLQCNPSFCSLKAALGLRGDARALHGGSNKMHRAQWQGADYFSLRKESSLALACSIRLRNWPILSRDSNSGGSAARVLRTANSMFPVRRLPKAAARNPPLVV